MWVIVKRTTGKMYVGILDSDPGATQGLTLRPGIEILFGPEHVIGIERPPEGYVVERFGRDFFEE